MKQLFSILSLCCAVNLVATHVSAQAKNNTVGISATRTTMLVFPASIIDADRGTEDISIRVNKKTPTVLKVKATEGVFNPTNLTVYTDDGRMYLTQVFYDSLAGDRPVLFSAENDGVNVLASPAIKGNISMQEVKSTAATLSHFPKRLHRPRDEEGGVRLALSNIWYKSEYLFFQFQVRNNSAIPFDTHFFKFYVRDNHRAKRTSVTEQEVIPEHTYSYPSSRTDANTTSTVVVVFNKFTIADNKHLTVQLFEADGDRHLSIDIKGRKLLATKLLP